MFKLMGRKIITVIRNFYLLNWLYTLPSKKAKINLLFLSCGLKGCVGLQVNGGKRAKDIDLLNK